MLTLFASTTFRQEYAKNQTSLAHVDKNEAKVQLFNYLLIFYVEIVQHRLLEFGRK